MYASLRHEDARAIENAVRGAINTVMQVIYSVNNARIQQYQRTVAEKDKENKSLKHKVKKAEGELIVLRRLRGCERSRNDCDNVNSSTCNPLSPEMEEQSIGNQNDVASEAEWNIDFPSFGARTPRRGTSQSQETATSAADNPMGLEHRSPTLQPPEAPERTRGQSPSPSPAIISEIKEEPLDMESVYIKWEMCEENLGEEEEEEEEQQHHLGPIEDSGDDYEGGASTTACNQRLGYSALTQHGEKSPNHLKNKLSSREKQRRYRARIRADPEKQLAYKEKERCKYNKKKVLISELPEENQEQRRAVWREAARRYRARKRSLRQTDLTQPCVLPQNTGTPRGTRGACRGRPDTALRPPPEHRDTQGD